MTAPCRISAQVDEVFAIASGRTAAEALARYEAKWSRTFWDRGDGYHANDPAAPVLFRCDGCDAPRDDDARRFCPDCAEVTGCYADTKPLYSPEFF